MNKKIFALVCCVSFASCMAMQPDVPQVASSARFSKIFMPLVKIVSLCKKHPVISTFGVGCAALVVAYTTCEQFRNYVDTLVGLRPTEDVSRNVQFIFVPEEFLRILQEQEYANQISLTEISDDASDEEIEIVDEDAMQEGNPA